MRLGSTSTRANVLVRNAFINFVGQVVPLVVGVVSLPIVVRLLGNERFGLLSLSWVTLTYFGMFDLGLGPAATKYIAEALAQSKSDEAGEIAYSALTAEGLVGISGTLVFWASTPILTGSLLNVSPELRGEATLIFNWLALGIPVVLVGNAMTAILQGAHRFDLLNLVRIPVNAATYVLPLLGAALNLSLPSIVISILVARLLATVGLAAFCLDTIPQLRRKAATRRAYGRLLRYGGWLAVTSAIGPILAQSDRFIVGSVISAAAIAFYAVPAEMAGRLSIIPLSLGMALFPAFSALDGSGEQRRLANLFARSLKFSLLAVGPLVVILALFADEILTLWMGPEFANQSAWVLRILALGSLINFIAYIPLDFLKGIGRPDMIGKLYVSELPIYIVCCFVLTGRWGLVGTAVAWSGRILLDTSLLYVGAIVLGKLPLRVFWLEGVVLTVGILLLLVSIALGLVNFAGAFPASLRWALLAVLFGSFVWMAWRTLLSGFDRAAVLQAIRGAWASRSTSGEQFG